MQAHRCGAGHYVAATTTLRNVVGGMTLEQTLTSRDSINGQLRGCSTRPPAGGVCGGLGSSCASIDPPPSIQDSMEKQMRADREKRAMIPTAEGSREAATGAGRGAEAGPDPVGRRRQAGGDPGGRGGDRQSSMLRAQGERAAACLQAQGAINNLKKRKRGAKAIEEDLRGDQERPSHPGDAGLPVPADIAADGQGRGQQGVAGAQRFRIGAAGFHQTARRCGGKRDGVFRYTPSPVEDSPQSAADDAEEVAGLVQHENRPGDRPGGRPGRGGGRASPSWPPGSAPSETRGGAHLVTCARRRRPRWPAGAPGVPGGTHRAP